MIRNEPGAATLVILTLAIGIGMAAAVFSILSGILFRPLPFEGGARIVSVDTVSSDRASDFPQVDPVYFHRWRERQRTFEELTAFRMYYAFVTVPGRGTRTFGAAEVLPGFFEMTATRPVLGRTLGDVDMLPASPPVVLIGDAVWRQMFGGDPGVIGRSLLVDSTSRVVVGVLPRGFEFPLTQQIWLPLVGSELERAGQGSPLTVAGKLAPGTSIAQARRELVSILRTSPAPGVGSIEDQDVSVLPYTRGFADARLRRAAMPALGVGLGVLLVACANVAGLFLGRAVRRRRDFAIAMSLGATRKRLVAEMLCESLLMSIIGASVGYLLAAGGIKLFNEMLRPSDFLQGFWVDVRLDLRVLLFVVALALASGALGAILPALRVASGHPLSGLRDAHHGHVGRPTLRYGRALIVGELAVTSCLLVAAGLMAGTVLGIQSLDPGFDARGILTGRVSIAQKPIRGRLEPLQFFDEVSRRLKQYPQVGEVAFASSLPARGSFWTIFEAEGGDELVDARARWVSVSPSFFDVFGVRILEGRNFADTDILFPNVAIVNERFARRFFGDESPIGHRFRTARKPEGGSEWLTVVGLVPDVVMSGLDDDRSEAAAYIHHGWQPSPSMEVAIRVEGDPNLFAPELEKQVASVELMAACFYVMTMEEVMARRYWVYTVLGKLFAILGAMALILSTVGLYGASAVNARGRLHEYGIRLALGAVPGDLIRSVLAKAMVQVLIGLALGLLVAAMLANLLSSVLYGIEVWTIEVYAGVAAVLLLGGFVAAMVPALIAARADPTETLKAS